MCETCVPTCTLVACVFSCLNSLRAKNPFIPAWVTSIQPVMQLESRELHWVITAPLHTTSVCKQNCSPICDTTLIFVAASCSRLSSLRASIPRPIACKDYMHWGMTEHLVYYITRNHISRLRYIADVTLCRGWAVVLLAIIYCKTNQDAVANMTIIVFYQPCTHIGLEKMLWDNI